MRQPQWDEAPEFGRRTTILRTLRRLWELHPGPAQIVETGTLRNDSPSGMGGDGWSTVAWAWYASRTGGRLWTVDCDAGNLEVSRRVTAPYAAHVEYVHADSVAFLSAWPAGQPLHLLYLDSCDYFDHAESETHNLREAQAALPHLGDPALVLIDDMHPAGGDPGEPLRFSGKGASTVPFLCTEGFQLAWAAEGQVLLERSGVACGPERLT